MLQKISSYKNKLEQLKANKPLVDKGTISKLLVMANLAEMAIFSNTKIPDADKHYFEGQAFVGRYFSDWGCDDLAEDYLKICSFIKEKHW